MQQRCSNAALPECFFHRVGGLAAHAGQHVTVGVERNGDAGVSEQLLDELRVDVSLEQERRAGVPEVVEGYLRQSCSLQESPEAPLAQVGRVDRRPSFGGEDEALVFVEVPEGLYLR